MNSKLTRAFSLIDLLLTVAAVVGITLAFLPYLAKTRVHSCRMSCSNNLKQISLAFRIWSGDNNDRFPMSVSATNGGAMEAAVLGSAYDVFLVLSNELNTPKILICPEESNPHRTAATSFATVTDTNSAIPFIPFQATNNLSYFVGLDASETNSASLLTGDDHFSVRGAIPTSGLLALADSNLKWRKGRHADEGNIAFADGSVHSLNSLGLLTAFEHTGFSTNRLAMP